eukprot:jgi/Galph1/2060/GphlegSOOS_G732.1
MQLRLRTKDGVQSITIAPQTKISELYKEIENKTGIQVAKQKVLYGFPQSKLQVDPETFVENVFHHGDMITVDQDTAQGHQQAQKVTETATNNTFVRRVVPDDNSCLFHAVSYVFRDSSVQQLRSIIAETVRFNPQVYNTAFLDRPNDEYCRWILQPETWGGAIELSILAIYFRTEITVFDIQTLRMDRYGETEGYEDRVFLLYDGIHYDPIAQAAYPEAPREYDITVFKVSDEEALCYARSLAESANQKREYTDLAGFTLVCGNCGAKLRGENGAVEHAKQTGHTNFTER